MKKCYSLAMLALVCASFFTLLIQSTCTAQLPSYIPANGLVAWYPFKGNANDERGNGNHCVVNGAVLTADRLGASNVLPEGVVWGGITSGENSINNSNIFTNPTLHCLDYSKETYEK